MDLSKVSTADLQALQGGDLSKVSTEGLQALHVQHQAQAQPFHPAETQDSAQPSDSALGKFAGVSPGMAHTMNTSAKGYQNANNIAVGVMGGPSNLVSGPAGNSAASGQLSGLLSKLSQKTGLSSIPDYLMQKAVGMSKYVPGVGNTLVDEGMVGTRGMLQGQAGKKIAQRGEQLTSAVGKIASPIDSEAVSKGVGDAAKDYTTSSGIVPGSVEGEVNQISGRASDIAGRGQVAPSEALELKRIAQREGYREGRPLAQLDAKLAQKEASGYGQALEDAYGQQHPGAPNDVEDLNGKLSALLKANKSLQAPYDKPGLVDTASGIGAAAGGLLGHSPLAVAGGIAAAKAAQSSLGQSLAAQGLQKGGQLTRAVATNPLTLQELIDQIAQSKSQESVK